MGLWGHCSSGRLRESLHVWGCLSLDPYMNDIVTTYRILCNCCSSKFNRHCFIIEFSHTNKVWESPPFFFVSNLFPSHLDVEMFSLYPWNLRFHQDIRMHSPFIFGCGFLHVTETFYCFFDYRSSRLQKIIKQNLYLESLKKKCVEFYGNRTDTQRCISLKCTE